MNDTLAFQYCQKLVVLNLEDSTVLLARRKGEADYDGVYSFIGGKLETTDGGFLAGAKREKDEEIGADVRLSVCTTVSFNAYFNKKDGSAMVLPHLVAYYLGGEIELSEEYADYKWVPLAELNDFEPKIDTIVPAVEWAHKIGTILSPADFSEV